MGIEFQPSLRTSTTLRVPEDVPEYDLIFYAVLPYPEYESLVAKGAALELWSDVPSRDGKQNEWGAHAFHRAEQSITGAGTGASAFKLKLSALPGTPSTSADSLDSGSEVVLQCRCSVSTPESRPFSFTYRVKYPDGNIQWQAGDHDNGSIIVQRYPTLLEQREGWKDSSSGVQSFSSPSAYGSLDAEVAKVVREPGITWNGWAIDNQSVIAFALDGAIAPHAASLITLIPTFEPRSHVEFRQSFMLHVSLPASISIGPGGEVLLNSEAGGESLHLRKLSSSLADASSSEPNELQRHLGNLYSLSPDFVALAVPGTPILKLYLLPLFPSKGETRISIPHSLIFPHFPSGSRLLVFSPDTHTANFLDESIPLEGTVQSHGGYLIITPAMELGSGWLVASLSNISIVDKILQPPSVENQATVPSSQLANPSNSGSDAQSNALFAPAVQLALLVNMLLALFFASLGGKPSSFHPNPDLPVNGQIDGAQSGPMEAQDPPLSDLNEKQQTLAFDLRNTPQTFSFLFHKAGSSISELSFALGQQEFEPHVQALNGSDGSYLVSLEREHKETGLEVSIRE